MASSLTICITSVSLFSTRLNTLGLELILGKYSEQKHTMNSDNTWVLFHMSTEHKTVIVLILYNTSNNPITTH